MSLFFNDAEWAAFNKAPLRENFRWSLLNRVAPIVEQPGFAGSGADVEWWHHAFETLTSVALSLRFKKDASGAVWLRSTVLQLCERPLEGWLGPSFRDLSKAKPCGSLETAHLAMALAISLDLADYAFQPEEREKVLTALREKGIPLCRQWLDSNYYFTNWRCALLAGVAIPAAVMGDKALLETALSEYKLCCDAFQPDGSYGESLQYGGYAAWALALVHEALLRSNPSLEGTLPMPYAGLVNWAAQSLIANRPLEGQGDSPRPRSVNFNDSGALFAPSPDLLLHIATRAKDSHPKEAALAIHLFETLYSETPAQGPWDRSSFGFLPRWGFLTPPLLGAAVDGRSPEDLELPSARRFEAGPCIARSSWKLGEGIVFAFSGAPEKLHSTVHQHFDLNSVVVAYKGELLLTDPGHSCYRNSIRELDVATKSHNSCVFVARDGSVLQQREPTPARKLDSKPVARPARFLIAAKLDELSVFGCDAASAYGAPIKEFTRLCLLAGPNAVFIIDRVDTDAPLRCQWNWLANNRDGALEYKRPYVDRVVIRRGGAGMKIFISHEKPIDGELRYTHIHDAYHPLPGRKGEGASGSGYRTVWTESDAIQGSRLCVHMMVVDDYGMSAAWHTKIVDGSYVIEAPGALSSWILKREGDGFLVSDTANGRQYKLEENGASWNLSRA
jgi:hypothetical protein